MARSSPVRARRSSAAKRDQELDTSIEKKKGLPKGVLNFDLAAADGSRIGRAPVSSQGLPRPNGADFSGWVVANCQDKIETCSILESEFVPTLAAPPDTRNGRCIRLPECLRMNGSSGMPSRTMGDEIGFASGVEDGLGHDGTGGVAGTEERTL